MTTHLTEDQSQRGEALHLAHRLLSGVNNSKGPLTPSSLTGLLTDELPHAVALAEYILHGTYSGPTRADEPEAVDTIASSGSSSSLDEAPTNSRAGGPGECGYTDDDMPCPCALGVGHFAPHKCIHERGTR